MSMVYRHLRRFGIAVSFAALILSAMAFIPQLRMQTPAAHAATGDFVHELDFSQNCPSGIGVGIAFDGKNFWYSCYNSNPDLFKADANGTVLASYNVSNGLGALAYDVTHNVIWAGWGCGSGASGDVLKINPATGVGTLAFNATDPANNYGCLDDGLAYDGADDTLYISPDSSTTIWHYQSNGTVITSFPWAGSQCYNSGLAIGGADLYQGSDGCSHVYVADKSAPSTSILDFATNVNGNGVRDEDLECDNITFAPKTVMWSNEAYDNNALGDGSVRRAFAFEIPSGSCNFGGGGQLTVPFDLRPTSCPNPLNVGAQGVLPAAILGTSSFDVTKIDTSSIKLEGVAPLSSALQDVATPFTPFTGKKNATDCTTAGPDGYLDLTLKFDNQQVIAAVTAHYGTLSKGEVLVLHMSGKLLDGTPFNGEDVIVVAKS